MPSSRLSSQPTASTTIGVAVLGGILACTAWLMSPANAALPASGTASESAANVRPNRYGVPAKPWDANLGSHRAVVNVSEPAAAAKVHLEWRRRDPHPEAKTVIVANAKSDKPVANILLENVSSESGDVTFQPEGDSGEY